MSSIRRKPAEYLKTLQLIPDDIVLAIAAQDFDEADRLRCVCGWAIRESFARQLAVDPRSTEITRLYTDTPLTCSQRFGGETVDWAILFIGAEHDTASVETAIVDRLDEVVCGAPTSEGRERP